MICNSHNITLTSTVTGGFGDLTYLWTVLYGDCIIESGQTTPTISIYVGYTDVSIQLQVWDAYGCTTTCTVVISCVDAITGQGNIGINNLNISESATLEAKAQDLIETEIDVIKMDGIFSLIPNPASTMSKLLYEGNYRGEAFLEIKSQFGKSISKEKITITDGQFSTNIDLSSMKSGVYYVSLSNSNEQLVRPLIVLQ